nr:hypothetical protein [Tanacetum cinerariifolium]
DTNSVRVIKRALDKFSACSGLFLNNPKSIGFLSLNEEKINAITNVLPFATRKLPVRYLRVPLIAKSLSVKDYGCLLDKIKKSIHVYWASVFLLLTTIIKEINKLLKWFLWNQCDTEKGKAKVTWKVICRPKDQGGLGLKNLQIWNHALLAKHVWNIAIKKYTLGVKWVHSVKLRGKHIWGIKADINNCWGMGLLFQIISYRDLYDARLNRDLKVIVPNVDADVEDKIVWRDRNEKNMKFSVSMANTDMNTQNPMVLWRKELWNKIRGTTNIKDNILDLMNIVQALIDGRNGNNIRSVTRILVFAASVYSIWQERNGRIFRDVKRSCDDVCIIIVDMVKNKLLGLTVKDSSVVRDIERKLAISCNKISSKKPSVSMNDVLEKGPWMVTNKPLFVKKWCSKIGMEKLEKTYVDGYHDCKHVSQRYRKCMNGGVVTNGNEGIQNAEKVNENVEEYRGVQQDRNVEFMMQGKKKSYRNDYNRPGAYANTKNNRITKDKPMVLEEWIGLKIVRKNIEKVKDNVVEEIRKTANKFSVLNSLLEDNDQELRILKERMIVDNFLMENCSLPSENLFLGQRI